MVMHEKVHRNQLTALANVLFSSHLICFISFFAGKRGFIQVKLYNC